MECISALIQSTETVHDPAIYVQIFNILKRLKRLKVISQKVKGKTVYMIADGNVIWHKIDNTVVVNKNTKVSHPNK